MTNTKNAGFLVRFLADLIELLLFGLIFSVVVSILTDSQTLSQFVYALLLYIITLALPLSILGVFYRPLFTQYFGGNIGKLLTGLRVTTLDNKLLNFKQAFFRQTIGYTFSSVLFGLGFLSIIKDPEKRAFHDKAIGSKVVMTRNLWPLGLVVLILLLIVHVSLWTGTIQKFANSPLKSEFGFLMMNWQQELKDKEQLQPTPTSTDELESLDNYLNDMNLDNLPTDEEF